MKKILSVMLLMFLPLIMVAQLEELNLNALLSIEDNIVPVDKYWQISVNDTIVFELQEDPIYFEFCGLLDSLNILYGIGVSRNNNIESGSGYIPDAIYGIKYNVIKEINEFSYIVLVKEVLNCTLNEIGQIEMKEIYIGKTIFYPLNNVKAGECVRYLRIKEYDGTPKED